MRNYAEIGIQVGEILLPKNGVDLKKWAVIACDQYTSEPEYWQKVQDLVGDAPSTLKMVLPEVYLGTPEEQARIEQCNRHMKQYLAEDLFDVHDGLVLIEREVEGRTRRGLMLALDLENYDFSKGSQSLIRATEGTIIDRLPPRMRIRQDAPLEIPHILMLIDDPNRTVIEPLAAAKSTLRQLYQTELMLGSGYLRGYAVDDPGMEQQVAQALANLASQQRFEQAYGAGSGRGRLLFAAGDGNHSLATAKSIWEKVKPVVGMNHPARYALVEVENVHDSGLVFEPIHRVLFGAAGDWQSAMQAYFASQAPSAQLEIRPSASADAMIAEINRAERPQDGAAPAQEFGVVTAGGTWVVRVANPPATLAVGTLQPFLDDWMKPGQAGIDYVHGGEVLCRLGSQAGNIGFYLPAMDKNLLFKTVILEGSLPRKTFSMGEAHEKRFYMECRRIA